MNLESARIRLKAVENKRPDLCGTGIAGQKDIIFRKQSGELIEYKGKWSKNKPEQTGKQSGEVVENTCLWKKQTENKPESRVTPHPALKAS